MSDSDSGDSSDQNDDMNGHIDLLSTNRPRRGRPKKYLSPIPPEYSNTMQHYSGTTHLLSGDMNDTMIQLQQSSEYDPGHMMYSSADIRRQANRLIQQRRRANEPEEARMRRLQMEANARRVQRANETEEQRRERLRKNAEHIRLTRAMETNEEREVRRLKMADHRKQSRGIETEEQRKERLRKCALARRISRMNESEEAKAARRQREAASRRLSRMNETEEEKAERRRRTAEARRRTSSLSASDSEDTSIKTNDIHSSIDPSMMNSEQSMIAVGHYHPHQHDDNKSDQQAYAGQVTANHRLVRASENKDARDKRMARYDAVAYPVHMEQEQPDHHSISTEEMDKYYAADITGTGVVEATMAVDPKIVDSEEVRQQIFRKKFRPHDMINQSSVGIAAEDDEEDSSEEQTLLLHTHAYTTNPVGDGGSEELVAGGGGDVGGGAGTRKRKSAAKKK